MLKGTMMYRLKHDYIMEVFMRRTQIQIEEDQIEWLKDKARARGVSISQIIRESIAFFKGHEEKYPNDRKQRAIAAIGRFASQVSDVSERHDDYLTDAFREGIHHDK
jgi:hypothetical protein